jgi:hypothetical protein
MYQVFQTNDLSGYQRQGIRYPSPFRLMVKSNQANGPIQSDEWSNSIKRLVQFNQADGQIENVSKYPKQKKRIFSLR